MGVELPAPRKRVRSWPASPKVLEALEGLGHRPYSLAYERGSRTVQAFVERAARSGEDVRTPTAVVAQAWRGDPRQARLASLLRVDERRLTSEAARLVSGLLRRAGTTDGSTGPWSRWPGMETRS